MGQLAYSWRAFESQRCPLELRETASLDQSNLESADISREQPHPRGIMPDHLGHSNPVLSGRHYANWDFITAPQAPHGVGREDEVHRDI